MPVSTQADIAAPVAEVWELISDFGGIMRWHPLLVRCEVDGEGVGAQRRVHFEDWWALERLDALDHDKHFLAYSIGDSSRPPVVGAKGTMQLEALGPQLTRISWTSGLPDDHPFAAQVNGGLEAYYPTRIGHLRAALGL